MRQLVSRVLASLAFAVLSTAHAIPVSGQGTWETTLLGRDINGHAVASTDASAVFAYDSILHQTWLLTGNNTGMTWDSAKNWAAGLTVGTFSGWTLPSADVTCIGSGCKNGPMGKLWYDELGNSPTFAMTNTGPFKNLLADYWLGTVFADPTDAWRFDTGDGYQHPSSKDTLLRALAIRPGDVSASAVPEPGELSMVLAGLVFGGLALHRLQRRKVDLLRI